MRNFIYLFVSLFFITLSCSRLNNRTSFHIINNTDTLVTNIKISNGVNETFIDTIKANDNASIELIFKDVPKIDGGYKIIYERESTELFKNFGYYSNGISLSSSYKISIKSDTILISENPIK